MKKLLIATALILVSQTANAEYLAKLNGRPIAKEEVEASLAEVATMEDGKDPKFRSFSPDFQRAFLDKHIEKLLIIDAAFKAGVDKDPEVIKEVSNFENNLVQQKYLTDLVLKQRTDKRLRQIYADKFKARDGKIELHASHILLKTEDEAKKIKAQLTKGADFDVLAEKYSIDPGAKLASGDLDFFTEDEMVPDFSKAAFALKDGEISNPVKTEFGWHIIKVIERRKAKAPAYDDAIAELEEALATEVIDSEVARLRKQSRIEYLGDFNNKPTVIPAATNTQKPAASNKPAAPSKPTTPAPATTKPTTVAPKPTANAAPKPVATPAKAPTQALPKPAVSSTPKAPSTSSNINKTAKPAAPAKAIKPVVPVIEDEDKPTVETNFNKKN